MSSLDDQLNRARKLHISGRIKEAQKLYEKIISLKNDDFLIFSLLATTFLQLKNYREAIKNFTKSINLNPKFPDSFNNRGIAFAEIENYGSAIRDYDNAINLKKDYFRAHLNKAIALKNSQKFEQAIISFENCIKINPNEAGIYNNLGNLYIRLKKYNLALKAYNKAINLKGDFAMTHSNRGDLYYNLKKYDLALKDYSKAIKFKQNLDYVFGKYMGTNMYLNQWDNFDLHIKKIKEGIKGREKIINPFNLLSLIDDPQLHKIVSNQYSKLDCDKNTKKTKIIKNKKIKLGYFSADFKNHAVLYLMLDVFKNHDKSKFEIYGFNHSTNKDDMTKLVSKYFKKFIDCSSLSDKEIANLSIKNNIDIAINLTGHTTDSRDGIYKYKPAPIIVNYLGYPGTMGSNCYDYIIADEIVIPKNEKKNFYEEVIYLPKCYQPNQADIDIEENDFLKKDLDFPDGSFVFGSLNNNYKITPQIFKCWMKILKKTKNSILWLLVHEDLAKKNIQKEAIKHGVNIDKIFFADRVSYKEHLKRLKHIDLFLDTFPYGAHTTAREAIKMRVPIITMKGKSFASRVGSSILTYAGLQELITNNTQEYTELAIELASNKNKLKKINEHLNKKEIIGKISDHQSFTKDLEEIYTKMVKQVYSLN